jgi:hypothetical protein
MIAELAVTSGLGSSFDLMGIGWDWFGESVELCVNLCLLLDNNLGLRWDHVFCWTLPPVAIFYLIGILGSSTLNFHLVNRMLITCESNVGDFLHLTFL